MERLYYVARQELPRGAYCRGNLGPLEECRQVASELNAHFVNYDDFLLHWVKRESWFSMVARSCIEAIESRFRGEHD